MGIMGTLNVVFSSATRKLAFVLRILGPPYVSLMSTRSACTTTKYCISAYTVFATTLKVVVHKARDVPKTARRRAHSHFGRDSSRLVLRQYNFQLQQQKQYSSSRASVIVCIDL